MISSFRGLWRHPAFLPLWAGQATSMFGSLIGGFAYSLVAIITLHASPAQIALLNGCNLVPGILAGPWAGVVADRLRHRPLLITADLTRALLLASIPLAAFIHTLSMAQLYAVTLTGSSLTMLFDVSFAAYVPMRIPREHLVRVNSVLRGTEAAAEAGGFALAGVLVQLLSAPITIAFDALSFLLSAVALGAGGDSSLPSVPPPSVERLPMRQSMVEGWRFVRRDAVLRALAVTTVVWEMVGNAIGVVIMLFFVRDLHLQPLAMGPIFGIGGVSALAGALVAGRVVRHLGLGRALIVSLYVNNLGLLAVVLAGGPLPLVLLLLALGQATDGGRSIYEITVVSILQSRAPAGAIGRVVATYETLKSAAMLLGLLVGGVLGGVIGLRPVLVLALIAHLLVPLCLVFSPVRQITTLQPIPSVEGVAV